LFFMTTTTLSATLAHSTTTGVMPTQPLRRPCPECGGAGEVRVAHHRHVHPGNPGLEYEYCPECHGSGKASDYDESEEEYQRLMDEALSDQEEFSEAIRELEDLYY
jgi:DnaJ-class molecular chaperone